MTLLFQPFYFKSCGLGLRSHQVFPSLQAAVFRNTLNSRSYLCSPAVSCPQPVTPNQRLHLLAEGRLLQIQPTQVSDSGRYLCVATNVAGEDDQDFNVLIQGAPGHWQWTGNGQVGGGGRGRTCADLHGQQRARFTSFMLELSLDLNRPERCGLKAALEEMGALALTPTTALSGGGPRFGLVTPKHHVLSPLPDVSGFVRKETFHGSLCKLKRREKLDAKRREREVGRQVPSCVTQGRGNAMLGAGFVLRASDGSTC